MPGTLRALQGHGGGSAPGVSTSVTFSSRVFGQDADSNLLMKPFPKMDRPCVKRNCCYGEGGRDKPEEVA